MIRTGSAPSNWRQKKSEPPAPSARAPVRCQTNRPTDQQRRTTPTCQFQVTR